MAGRKVKERSQEGGREVRLDSAAGTETGYRIKSEHIKKKQQRKRCRTTQNKRQIRRKCVFKVKKRKWLYQKLGTCAYYFN